MADVGFYVVVIFDNINFFSAQFIDNRLNANAFLTHTGSDRIDSLFLALSPSVLVNPPRGG